MVGLEFSGNIWLNPEKCGGPLIWFKSPYSGTYDKLLYINIFAFKSAPINLYLINYFFEKINSLELFMRRKKELKVARPEHSTSC